MVYKEEGGQNPKLTIYPAKQDDFFIVLRRLSFEIDSINEATFQKQIFTRPIDFQKSEVNLGSQSFTVFEADQIRNQNLLHNQVWVSKLGEPKIWVWVQWKKENALLGSQLGTGSFLSRSEE